MSRKYQGVVLEIRNFSESYVGLRFRSSQKVLFSPGQFLSLVIPESPSHPDSVKRAYSFAKNRAQSEGEGYELCIRRIPGGRTEHYLSRLKVGDSFDFFAPYGEFTLRPSLDRFAVWIATGSGIAPFRSFLKSSDSIKNSLLIFGARSEGDLLYPGEFERAGVQRVNCLSRTETDSPYFFRGRVTDYLRALPKQWLWSDADFYLCGHSEMVLDVREFLIKDRNVSPSSIIEESFSPAPALQVIAKSA